MKPALLCLIVLAVAACTKPPVIDEAQTKAVLDHHIQTFQQNDLDGVMADYTEASVLVTPDRTFKGLAEIRENFVGAFQALPKEGTTMTVDQSVITGDIAYIVWHATTPSLEFKYATDTFVIQDGKIVRQTYAGDVMPISSPVEDGAE